MRRRLGFYVDQRGTKANNQDAEDLYQTPEMKVLTVALGVGSGVNKLRGENQQMGNDIKTTQQPCAGGKSLSGLKKLSPNSTQCSANQIAEEVSHNLKPATTDQLIRLRTIIWRR